MKKTVLIFGAIAGIIITVLFYLTSSLWSSEQNFKMGELIGYASMIIALSTIFFGIRSYRDKQLNGVISFGKAFWMGILITLVASVFYIAGWMLYSAQNPEIMEQFFSYSVQQIKESGASAAEIEQKVAEMEKFKEMYQNPLIQIGVTFTEIFPIGLIISLISALILKTRKVS